jgi:hypothetical protein
MSANPRGRPCRTEGQDLMEGTRRSVSTRLGAAADAIVGLRPMSRLFLCSILLLVLAGCDYTTTFRYKLTLEVETPDGVKSGSSVMQVTATEIWIPARGLSAHYKGEALYVDLGPGRRPLVALLTKSIPKFNKNTYNIRTPETRYKWGRDSGTALLEDLFSDDPQLKKTKDESYIHYMDRISHRRDRRDVPLRGLPTLVTFADINDPLTVIHIDPESPGSIRDALGAGISLKKATIEFVEPDWWWQRWFGQPDKAAAEELERRLPWLIRLRQGPGGGYLSGEISERVSDPRLASHLQYSDFIKGRNR